MLDKAILREWSLFNLTIRVMASFLPRQKESADDPGRAVVASQSTALLHEAEIRHALPSKSVDVELSETGTGLAQ
jgi:hypothetical protein